MIRVVKRYGSRKLYDTEESRYVSLEEMARWIRSGQDLRVVDNETEEDVTALTLAQIIVDMERRRAAPLTSELLHAVIRRGGELMSSGIEQVQHGIDKLLDTSLDRIPPVRRAREEMARLRASLEDLESSLAGIEEARSVMGSAAEAADAAGGGAPGNGEGKAGRSFPQWQDPLLDESRIERKGEPS